MMKIITDLIDSFFPPRESELLVRTLQPHRIISQCDARSVGEIIYLLPYQDAVVSALIIENKFHNNKAARTALRLVVANWLSKQATPHTLVPIPLSSQRFRERGYNQVTEILKGITAQPHTLGKSNLLLRQRHTVPQTQLERTARLKNLSQAFTVSTHAPASLGHVLLIDDVTTTGATLHAAKAALLTHDPTATVTLLAIAH